MYSLTWAAQQHRSRRWFPKYIFLSIWSIKRRIVSDVCQFYTDTIDSHFDAADKTGSWAGLITNIRLTASARSAVSEGTAYKLETKEKLGRFLIERKHLRRKKQWVKLTECVFEESKIFWHKLKFIESMIILRLCQFWVICLSTKTRIIWQTK